jgi:hypothetical protein
MTDLRTDNPKLRLFAELPTGYTLSFGQGNFDEWCIHFQDKSGFTFFPLDTEYFAVLKSVGEVFDAMQLYSAFVAIYEKTGKEQKANPEIEEMITQTALFFYDYRHELLNSLYLIYAGMVAEENKENTRLGKRIKRLGIHQVLVEKMQPYEAANFSRGMPWRDIDKECKIRGF